MYEWYFLIAVSGFLSPKINFKCIILPIIWKTMELSFITKSNAFKVFRYTIFQLPLNSRIK